MRMRRQCGWQAEVCRGLKAPASVQHHVPITGGSNHADHVVEEAGTRQQSVRRALAVVPAAV
jgi:hypothetical protein